MGTTTMGEATVVADTRIPGHGVELRETGGSGDRRVYRRYGCDGNAEVLVIGKGLRFSGKILDVSEGGCFIEAPHQLERGTHVELTFAVDGMQFRVAGGIRVVRLRSGIGVGFTNMNVRRKELIQQLLDQLAAQANQPPDR